MSWSPKPSTDGIYHVKAFSDSNIGYWRHTVNNSVDKWPMIDDYNAVDADDYAWKITMTSTNRCTCTIEPVATSPMALGLSSQTELHNLNGYGIASIRAMNKGTPALEWEVIPGGSGKYSRISLISHPKANEGNVVLEICLDRDSNDERICFSKDEDSKRQRWIFRKLDGRVVRGNQRASPEQNRSQGDKSFENMFFTLTPRIAKNEKYDIIIIGTGIGGGVVAGDLFDSNSRMGEHAKSVLVIERGGLTFHSHCLNASRPAGFGEDRGQQNDTFFAKFKDNYTFPSSGTNSDWKGGPMYNLGGRSAAWGLFAPRIHDETLKNHMQPIRDPLLSKWYREAENLMSLYLPTTNAYQANVMERLNMTSEPKLACQWQWGRIASEFRDDGNFDFARGAYSTIDKLLEIAMSKKQNDSGEYEEHPNWKILLHSEVRSIKWDACSGDGTTALGVRVRDVKGNGDEITIGLKKGGKIVLGAGSVHSPAILMRSDKEQFLKDNGGLHLTDHDIFAKAYTFQYTDEIRRETIGAMKLQTYVNLPSQDVALCNISIDASSFLPREFLPNEFFRNEQFPRLIFAFIKPCRLNPNNTIELDDKKEPVVTIKREIPFKNDNKDVIELRELTKTAKEEIRKALKIEYIKDKGEDSEEFFKPLELGGVAHELGTIPFSQNLTSEDKCLKEDLSLRGHEGLYVCDLSIFPMSPEVNPTLTLAALALRLSREVLLPRKLVRSAGVPEDTVWIMNQTGEKIKVFISNNANVKSTDDDKKATILGPGVDAARMRKRGCTESVAVYRLKYNSDKEFLDNPTFWKAKAGELTIICDK
ncbi:FAD/NAD(P)-binding domain-containing protein [Schizopora paradoxa]|uniref:FAD/NAD(P)-binding domain-containing protein n=1 Tax=Schizopora paradoxa TaxID=27342 RepID=A0A0H2S752_9AGAM|nr:FAD/NAD(P)-binding domain-containing protein [Schizopora paradoxa]